MDNITIKDLRLSYRRPAYWAKTLCFHLYHLCFIRLWQYFSFRAKSIMFKVTPIAFAIAITISPFNIPYKTHKDSPVIREIISHFETSSVFRVLSDFLIWGTVLHKLNKVAEMPIKKTRSALILLCHNMTFLKIHHKINLKESLSSNTKCAIFFIMWCSRHNSI